MLADVVVAVVDDDKLSTILPSIHSAGLGHVTLALGANRGDIREQLRRAGIPIVQSPDALSGATRVLLVKAAARSAMTADLLLQHGAIAVWIVTKSGFWSEVDDRAEIVAADVDLLAKPAAAVSTGPEIRIGDHVPAVRVPASAPDMPSPDQSNQ